MTRRAAVGVARGLLLLAATAGNLLAMDGQAELQEELSEMQKRMEAIAAQLEEMLAHTLRAPLWTMTSAQPQIRARRAPPLSLSDGREANAAMTELNAGRTSRLSLGLTLFFRHHIHPDPTIVNIFTCLPRSFLHAQHGMVAHSA